jgi:hypothetical protein
MSPVEGTYEGIHVPNFLQLVAGRKNISFTNQTARPTRAFNEYGISCEKKIYVFAAYLFV